MNERLFERIQNTIQGSEPYPGYPSTRLSINAAELEAMTQVEIPEGPWQINDKDLPSPDETAAFIAAGYDTDSLGRPLHPAFRQMVTNPDLGVVTGKGRYWNWGPNRTADPIVMTQTACPRVLLIKRGDTGSWALPGGFVDPEDADASVAALRELGEEAGLTGVSDGKEVYVGVVGDKRTTAHAWAETSAYLYQLERQVPVAGADDAVDAKWVRLDKLGETLFGSHEFLIEEALPLAQYEQKKPIVDILGEPKENLNIEIIDAGHMAYDHLFVRDGDSTLFVKEHVASRFTDPFREAHSRAYLEKEFALFEHVAERGYGFVPDRVDLVDDSLLAMDALHEDDGWLWRAPKDAEAFHAYTTDVLDALEQLELVPLIENPEYHKDINPTYETYWAEGWDDITDDKFDALVAKINELSSSWSDDQKELAQELIATLPELRGYADRIDRHVELFMAHNDARQSNIAWHPTKGARLVDWSWGDPAPHHSDTTMFLVDLAKGGYDVSPYYDKLNSDQLINYVGFLLAHSLWQTRDGSTTVREQQVASATAAFRILKDITA